MVNVQRLKAAIVLAGYTQRTLAPAMGMSKNTLNAKVNGRAPVYCDEALRFCEVLGISDPNDKVEIFLT